MALAGCGDKSEAPKGSATKVDTPSPEAVAKAAADKAMQDEAKEKKDQGECGALAKQQTWAAVGGGERVRGAARGALGGAVIGGIADDVGTGAAVGATVGVVRGGAKARKNQEAQNQQAQHQPRAHRQLPPPRSSAVTDYHA